MMACTCAPGAQRPSMGGVLHERAVLGTHLASIDGEVHAVQDLPVRHAVLAVAGLRGHLGLQPLHLKQAAARVAGRVPPAAQVARVGPLLGLAAAARCLVRTLQPCLPACWLSGASQPAQGTAAGCAQTCSACQAGRRAGRVRCDLGVGIWSLASRCLTVCTARCSRTPRLLADLQSACRAEHTQQLSSPALALRCSCGTAGCGAGPLQPADTARRQAGAMLASLLARQG